MTRSPRLAHGVARGEVEGQRREGRRQIWEGALRGWCKMHGAGGGAGVGWRWESRGVVGCVGISRIGFGGLWGKRCVHRRWGRSGKWSRQGQEVARQRLDARRRRWSGRKPAAVGSGWLAGLGGGGGGRVEYFDLDWFGGKWSGRRLNSLSVQKYSLFLRALPREWVFWSYATYTLTGR